MELMHQKTFLVNIRRWPLCKNFFVLIAALLLQSANSQAPSVSAAVKSNDARSVKLLLERGADPNAYDDDSDNVLINAAVYASADCMKLLLDKKANPNLKNKAGQTALMYCTHEMDKMKLLLQYGADINAKSKTNNTPLLIACVGSGQYENIKFLIENGADPFAKNYAKETTLMRAAQYCDTMIIHLLLSKGLPVDETAFSYTAMMYATGMANWPVVLCLLDHGADPDLRDRNNMPPVLSAAQMNSLDVVKAMLKKMKYINTVDSLAGMTPLMWATYNEHDNPEIIQAFLDKGALVNIKARDGSTALSWAMKKGNTATVALLKKAGAQ
jgi:ankyrin repeat protein